MANKGIHRTGGSAGTAMLDEDQESRRASSRGIIPRAKIKTVKMTFVIVFGEFSLEMSFVVAKASERKAAI